MGTGRKYYVVWEGRQPGVYDNWEDAEQQVANWPDAKYKSYKSKVEAIEAFRKNSASDVEALASLLLQADGHNISKPKLPWIGKPGIDCNGVAVDASCLGNPGTMEYRGVTLADGKEIFRMGPFKKSTNNIGEYLALVHILALCEKKNVRCTIYSDSKTAMAWLRRKGCKTTLKRTSENADSFALLDRADLWVRTHVWNNPVVKWNTSEWGEIPADFGRK